ncbi:MAG: 1-acyl-sn-glycerol-3-phosphate acyltransferase [Pseudomonadota bacterium]
MESLDQLADLDAWSGLSRPHIIPFVESATQVEIAEGETLFTQYHPAQFFYLLLSGEVLHVGAAADDAQQLPFDPVNWPWAALGWAGFLPPDRYGTTARATRAGRLLRWSHRDLARLFYADPALASAVFDLVLASVKRQFEGLRAQRLRESGLESPFTPVAGRNRPLNTTAGALACLRQSAFFGRFGERNIATLAASAAGRKAIPGEKIVTQGDSLPGLLLVHQGSCDLVFEQEGQALAYRRNTSRPGLVAGIPGAAGPEAEASVYARESCRLFEVSTAAIDDLRRRDPEFGRTFKQRMLARFAGLIAATRVVHDRSTPDPEVAAVANLIANNQTRIAVTSKLHKVPHLLSHRLSIGDGLEILERAGQRMSERMLAAQCRALTQNLSGEHAFYQAILETCDAVMNAPEEMPAPAVRMLCDEHLGAAFSHLNCRVEGLEHLPRDGGFVAILNHLSSPEYYELPNQYHFSFDTAFVGWLVWRRTGRSALRVVRQSPDQEYGHNLFYRRLGHLWVPTVESGLSELSESELAARRRRASKALLEEGERQLAAGTPVVLCPEGQSQPVELSPAHFHSGAFRLALRAGVPLVAVALGGFHRRFKDGPLVAHVQPPVDLKAEGVDADSLRDYVDRFRRHFAPAVEQARREAESPS